MMSMVEKAAAWWSEQLLLSNTGVTKEMANRFEKQLSDSIKHRIVDHWFPDNPARGQGYRSICLDTLGRPDPILVKAAKAASINNIFDYFSYVESIVMWIDPDGVAVKIFWAYSPGGKEQVIYKTKSAPVKEPSSSNQKIFVPVPSLQSNDKHPLQIMKPLSPIPLQSSPSLSTRRPSFSLQPHHSSPSTPYPVYAPHTYTTSGPFRPPSPLQPTPYPHPHKPYHLAPRNSVYSNMQLSQYHNGWTSRTQHGETNWGDGKQLSQQQDKNSSSKMYWGLPLEAQA